MTARFLHVVVGFVFMLCCGPVSFADQEDKTRIERNMPAVDEVDCDNLEALIRSLNHVHGEIEPVDR